MGEHEIWQSDYDWISEEIGGSIAKRRIRKLAFMHNGRLMIAEVGKPNPYNGIPLRKIYQDALRKCFFLCGGTITIAPDDSLVEEY